MRFFCFNDIKMRHLKNSMLEKYLVSYRFVNLELVHPERRNSEQTDIRFFNIEILQMISDIEILRFEITYFSNLTHAWYVVVIVTIALKACKDQQYCFDRYWWYNWQWLYLPWLLGKMTNPLALFSDVKNWLWHFIVWSGYNNIGP